MNENSIEEIDTLHCTSETSLMKELVSSCMVMRESVYSINN